MIQNIKGYHTNDNNICEEFIKNQSFDLLVCQEDAHYLGRGVYFWDSISNAKYWKKRKESVNNEQIFSILSCNLLLDDLLDLTDQDAKKLIEELWTTLKSGNTVGVADHIGEIIDYLFETLEEMQKFRILKMIAKYGYPLYKNKNKVFSGFYANDVRTIYCVKKEGVICGEIRVEKVG